MLVLMDHVAGRIIVVMGPKVVRADIGCSDYTVRRARDANIKTVGTDGEFVEASE